MKTCLCQNWWWCRYVVHVIGCFSTQIIIVVVIDLRVSFSIVNRQTIQLSYEIHRPDNWSRVDPLFTRDSPHYLLWLRFSNSENSDLLAEFFLRGRKAAAIRCHRQISPNKNISALAISVSYFFFNIQT